MNASTDATLRKENNNIKPKSFLLFIFLHLKGGENAAARLSIIYRSLAAQSKSDRDARLIE